MRHLALCFLLSPRRLLSCLMTQYEVKFPNIHHLPTSMKKRLVTVVTTFRKRRNKKRKIPKNRKFIFIKLQQGRVWEFFFQFTIPPQLNKLHLLIALRFVNINVEMCSKITKCCFVCSKYLKIAEAVPTHKAGNKNLVNNYRSIFLTSNFARIVGKFYKKRILSFITKHIVVNNLQFELCKGRGTKVAVVKNNWLHI